MTAYEDDLELWDAKMGPKHGVTLPKEVIESWGIPKGKRTIVYFTLDERGRVLVIPARHLKTFLKDE